MPAKGFYHDTFVTTLKKDGWTITHDPLTVSVGKTDLLIDLGAERILAAERGGERIAVEIKSFIKLYSKDFSIFSPRYLPPLRTVFLD